MKSRNLLKSGIILALTVPYFANAAAALTGVKEWVKGFGDLVNTVYLMLFGIALLVFVWSMIQVIVKAGDPKAKEEARNRMIWGVIAIFIMFSIMGIVQWIGGNLNIEVSGAASDNLCSSTNTDPNCIGG